MGADGAWAAGVAPQGDTAPWPRGHVAVSVDAQADPQTLQGGPSTGRVRRTVDPAAVPECHHRHTLSWLHTLAWEGMWLPGATFVRLARQHRLQNTPATASGHSLARSMQPAQELALVIHLV